MLKNRIITKPLIGLLAFLISILLNLSVQNTYAGAGYYPVKIGEVLNIQTCIPVDAQLPVLIQVEKSNRKWVTIKEINTHGRSKGSCESKEFFANFRWKVNLLGGHALRAYDIKSKDWYFIWPDGIDSKSSIRK